MKALLVILAITLGICFSFAQQGAEEKCPSDKDWSNYRQQILKKFDKDGDGKLSQDERAEYLKTRREWERKSRTWDLDDDRDVEPWEKRMNRRSKQRFDEDDDGSLSPEERAKFRKDRKHLDREIGPRGPHGMRRGFRDDDSRPGHRWDDEESGPDRRQLRERLLEKFDKDGDGRLSPEEREKAREAMKQRFGQRDDDMPGRRMFRDDDMPDPRRRMSRDGDENMGEMRERLLKKFDKDGDGRLSPEEREKAREAMKQRFGQRDDDMPDPRRRMSRDDDDMPDPRRRMFRDDDDMPDPRRRMFRDDDDMPDPRRRMSRDDDDMPDPRRRMSRDDDKDMGEKRQELRKRLLKHFDIDGDGSLSPEEREKLREFLDSRWSDDR